MQNTGKKRAKIEQAGEDLFKFAIDREDLKEVMAHLPLEADIRRVTVEYELQILKIISVGWSLSYYLENSPQKNQLARTYWEAIREFSTSLSTTTELLVGHDIDYFQILKDRLDMYLDALSKHSDASQPVAVIGPEFARTCGNVDDAFTVLCGARMFTATMGSVKEYLEAARLT
jgi:hypothetical protein